MEFGKLSTTKAENATDDLKTNPNGEFIIMNVKYGKMSVELMFLGIDH